MKPLSIGGRQSRRRTAGELRFTIAARWALTGGPKGGRTPARFNGPGAARRLNDAQSVRNAERPSRRGREAAR